MRRVEGETTATGPFQVEQERDSLGELIEFDSDSPHRCAGIGIYIIEGDKTVKATRCPHINEGISASFL